jgi:hypothetical protein
MRKRWALVTRAFCACGILLLASHAVAGEPTHPRSFWSALKATGFQVPADTPVLPLALEAAQMLGATDGEVRDSIAYEAVVAWVYKDHRLQPSELAQLRGVLAGNAVRGLGDGPGDGIFLRSFSLLALSVLAATDLKTPFLDQRGFDELFDLAERSLSRERDLRGYVEGKGWAHGTAHGADLLKFLARSEKLRRDQQARLIDAVAGRLRSARQVFVWGEDARLAWALAQLAKRPDFDQAPLDAWLARVRAEHTGVWAGPFSVDRYIAVRAQLNALSELSADLAADERAPAALVRNLKALREAIR